MVGTHGDEGPEDRYRVRYDPITYNQHVKAPLPGLALEYKMVDWDGDGRTDILANVRRGAGIVFYRNVGTEEKPRFRSLHENDRIMERGALARYFGVLDFDGDGTLDLIGFDSQGENARFGGGGLAVHFNEGTPTEPHWRKEYVQTPDGDTLRAPAEVNNAPRIAVVDWDGDGRKDLVLGMEDLTEMFPPEHRDRPGFVGGFHDPDLYEPESGYVAWARNRTQRTGGEDVPVFKEPERLEADGAPIETYVNPYPATADLDGDGREDLIVGSHRPGLRVFANEGSGSGPDTPPRLREVGLLEGPSGTPIDTYLTIRVSSGDLDADGGAELVGGSYFGNQNRYVLYDQEGDAGLDGWQYEGYLSLEATPETPIYGMGNSTVDPVDFDGDGDRDLLLGAEASFPTWVENVGSNEEPVFEPAERLRYVDGSLLETYSLVLGEGSHWGPFEWYSDRIAPRAEDWNGDGTLDLVTGSMGRRMYFFEGRRVGGELRFERPEIFQRDGEELVVPDRLFPGVMDWTGDGRLDLVISNQPGHVLVYPGDGSLELGEPIRLDHPDGRPIVLADYWGREKGNRSGFTVTDWTGDGERDLLIYRFHLGIYLYPNEGNDTFGQARRLVPLYSHLAGPSVIDWDGDGVLDILVGGDERRMIEPSIPAHLVVYHGRDVLVPPGGRKRASY